MRVRTTIGAALVSLLLSPAASLAGEPAPLEAYAALPSLSLAAVSPSGRRMAVRARQGDQDLISIFELETNQLIAAAGAQAVNPRYLRWINDDDLLLIVSDTRNVWGVRGSFDYSSAVHFDVRTGASRQLLKGARRLYPVQSGLGTVAGVSADAASIFMPAFVRRHDTGAPSYGLYQVHLQAREDELLMFGKPETIDWFLDRAGQPRVREDFDDENNIYALWRLKDEGEEQLLYREETPAPSFAAIGLTASGDSLLIAGGSSRADGDDFYLMNLASGAMTEAGLSPADTTVNRIIRDHRGLVVGAEYAGLRPRYRFFDQELEHRVELIQTRMPDTSQQLIGWSEDFNRLVFLASGALTSGAYVAYDGITGPRILGVTRPDIKTTLPVSIIEYEARDGLAITALVTASAALREAGNAPLVVLPHGGPRANDQLGFDWLAQFLASRGAIVLQPQYRGSTGFGRSFTEKGHGEWGQAMSTDLDDGVVYLVEQGMVDPGRVCMVGASYGGYAALAAGAFSDFPYRCLVSVAGISDLYAMLRDERRAQGDEAWTLDYWATQFGAGMEDRALLEARSPAEHAEAFSAPVLLIHGRDDTVVSPDQSRIMQKALRKADKPVQLEWLKGEDHWLTQAETRLQTLREIDRFLQAQLFSQ